MAWLGIDGGGTKTQFVLFGDDMRVERTFRLGTCHPGQVGYDGLTAVLREGVSLAVAAAAGPLAGVGLGLAGYGQDPVIRRQMREAVAQAVGELPFELVNDVEEAWAASLGLRDGIVVICGTGSIGYGRRGERALRAGGWGYQVGDEGSGYWMGTEVLRLFSRQADGRDPRGPLFDVVMERLCLSAPYDIITYARDELAGDRTKIAALTAVLREAARAGDPAARAVYARAAEELAALVGTVYRALWDEGSAGPVPVGYVGGVFEGAPDLLTPAFAAALPAGCTLADAAYEPAAGPVLMLRRRLGRGEASAC